LARPVMSYNSKLLKSFDRTNYSGVLSDSLHKANYTFLPLK